MATRTQARTMVIELLYAYAMGNERIFDFADELLGTKKIRNAQADFAKGLFSGTVAHLQSIDSVIEASLKSWEISRLGVVDKCILRLGVYEILKGEIDAPVAINEALEIAKILGAENTGKFVNGILDTIAKQKMDLKSAEKFAQEFRENEAKKARKVRKVCESSNRQKSANRKKTQKTRDSRKVSRHESQKNTHSRKICQDSPKSSIKSCHIERNVISQNISSDLGESQKDFILSMEKRIVNSRESLENVSPNLPLDSLDFFAKRAAPPTPLPLRAKKLRFFCFASLASNATFRGRASLFRF